MLPIDFLKAIPLALIEAYKVLRGTISRSDLHDEADYDREIGAIWDEFEFYKRRRHEECEGEVRRESYRFAAKGRSLTDSSYVRGHLDRIRRGAQEDIMQRGREAQRKAGALERERNRRFRVRRAWREWWK